MGQLASDAARKLLVAAVAWIVIAVIAVAAVVWALRVL
jgi:hypothetical protein